MKTPVVQPGVEWAVLALCLWQSADLATAWQHSPFDRLGWLALGIWLVPALIAAFVQHLPSTSPARTSWRAWTALALDLSGGLLGMHVLMHGALAFAFAAVAPAFRRRNLWLLLALCWMPALGWLMRGLSPVGVVALRLGLASAAVWLSAGPVRLARRASFR